jgi:cysteinylglycine-S-conjugate dipeptidase
LVPVAARGGGGGDVEELADLGPGEFLVTGVEDPDNRAHGPDEGLHLPEFERAVLAEALLLQRLGGAQDRPPEKR